MARIDCAGCYYIVLETRAACEYDYKFALRPEEAIPTSASAETCRMHTRWDRNVFSSMYYDDHRPAARRDWCLAVVRAVLHRDRKDLIRTPGGTK